MSVEGIAQQGAAAIADRAARNAAITLALTLPGDTVLYLLLPIYAATFGVTLPEAGILLAANRIVRIIGYGWVATYFAEQGPRAACLLAALGAAAATLAYATMSGLWPLLIARLMWGLSFAAMNIANQALATSVGEGAARRMGHVRMIIAVGPTAGLIVGAVLAYHFGPRIVFGVLAAVACLAPLYARLLPDTREPIKGRAARFERPDAISIWSFSTGFTLDGLFIFGLGLLAAASYPNEAVLAAGFAMAVRYATEIAFSTAGGLLGHRYGAGRVLIGLSFVTAATLALLAVPGPLLWVGVFGTIILRALTQTLLAPAVAEAFPGDARVPALARQATWRDIGAGIGPLAAGILFPIAPAWAIYVGAALLVTLASVRLLKAGAPNARRA